MAALLTADDLPEHVELVLNDLLDDDENLLVCHRGNVKAAILDLPVDDLPEHSELVLNDIPDGDLHLLAIVLKFQ